MPDNSTYYVPAIAVRVPDGAGFISSGLCGHTSFLMHDGISFLPAVEIDYSKVGDMSMDLTASKFKISMIPAEEGTVFGSLYDRVPFSFVEAFVYELEVDISNDTVISGRKILKGLVYNASSRLDARILSLELREDKYYYDKVAGVVCTEQCAVAFFGDKICKLPVTTVSAVVQSISGTVITLTGTPAGVAFIYNNGYIEFEGLRLKTDFWESGAVFSMAEIPPSSWVGATVTVAIGCDKTLASCRIPHNNESEFFGLGHSMVDYSALYEET